MPLSNEPPLRIVAEALITLGEAPIALRPGPPASAREVAARLARSALPPEADVTGPTWLRAGQQRVFRRAVAAIEEFGGALVAEPPGTGKTYIALAVAAVSGRGRAVCLAPAALADQWRATAAALGQPLTIATHERASRGRLPAVPGFAIIDESHHYRNPAIHRYGHVARWLVGRRAVLLTATPLVNRLSDLTAQLALVLTDDALAHLGVASLRELAVAPTLPAQLAGVVLTSPQADPGLPVRRLSAVRCEGHEGVIAAVDRLALSRSPAIAALIRGVMLRAAASSPAALAGALRRYRLLLSHAQDAHAAGVRPGRAALRRWIGEAAVQTALWPLLGDDDDFELLPDDLDTLTHAEQLATGLAHAADPKAMRLAAILADRRRTLVFTAARETAIWLRDRLGPRDVAWCTGDRAGIGRSAMARRDVLAAFGPESNQAVGPRVLIATDVAAEGLDLQGAERVIHYDLPWTPMRLEQREGRAARLGNRSGIVEVVRLDPPVSLDARLRQSAVLIEKARLPIRAGLAGEGLDRWRSAIERVAQSAGSAGTAAVQWSDGDGALAGLSLVPSASSQPCGTIVLWCGANGDTSDDPAWLTRALGAAATAAAWSSPTDAELATVLAVLGRHARRLLRNAHGAHWLWNAPAPAARRLARRLGAVGRQAARDRSAGMLDAVDHALRFVSRGHTAGESLLVAETAALPSADLRQSLTRLPPSPDRGTFDVHLGPLILFRSEAAPLR